jgi:hypothetical protein
VKHRIDGSFHLDRFGNIVANEPEAGPTLEGFEVFQAAGN